MIMKLTPADLKALSAPAWDVTPVEGGVVIESEDINGFAVFVYLADDVIDTMNRSRAAHRPEPDHSRAYYQVRMTSGMVLTYSSALPLNIEDTVEVPVQYDSGHFTTRMATVSGYGKGTYDGPEYDIKEIIRVVSRAAKL
jgi:hypothetical protein